MPMTFGDQVRQLTAKWPQLEWSTAAGIIWQAALLVYQEHPWSWCVKEGRITTEPSFGAGSVSVLTGDRNITLTGGVWDPTWEMRRFTGGGRNEEYPVTISTTTTGLLDFPWLGEDNTALAYTLFRDVYPVPDDCDYGREYFVMDPTRSRMLRFKDLGTFVQAKARVSFGGVGYPLWVTRVGTTSSGVPLLRFGPEPPSAVEAYPMVYFGAPQKPASPSDYITPIIPTAWEDLIWRRGRWLYSEERGKSMRERDDLRRIYYERYFDAIKACDGGVEVERYMGVAFPGVVGDDLYPLISIRVPEV